jgi:hypothetical protein
MIDEFYSDISGTAFSPESNEIAIVAKKDIKNERL